MASTLRQLLVQRAARLQGRPAFTAPGWGTLSYAQFRNRVEGIALGLLAEPCPPGSPARAGEPGPWAWAAEVAAACCGLLWDEGAPPVDSAVLGGPRFNSEDGRGPYHDREEAVAPELTFHRGLSQGEVLRRLARLNAALGWDHETSVAVPLEAAASLEGRAALWSALYAGAHATLEGPAEGAKGWFRRRPPRPAFDPAPFAGFWDAPG